MLQKYLELTSSYKLTRKFLSLIITVTLVALLLGNIIIYFSLQSGIIAQTTLAAKSLRTEQEAAAKAQLDALELKATVIGKFMSETGIDFILSQDLTTLETLQKEATNDSEVSYALYLNPEGDPVLGQKIPSEKENIITKRFPVVFEGTQLGSILLGISREKVKQNIEASNQRIDKAIAEVKKNGRNQVILLFIILMVIGVIIITANTAVIYLLFKRLVITPLDETTLLMNELAKGEGDLTVTLPIVYQDEIGLLRVASNVFLKQLRQIIHSIKDEVSQIFNATKVLNELSGSVKKNSDNQSQQINLVGKSANEMASSIREVSQSAEIAAETARQGAHEARGGQQLLDELTSRIDKVVEENIGVARSIKELEEDSKQVDRVIKVISDITFQTNLLALNAAIEAARAGVYGKGFAVVADEVKTLAFQTKESTDEIRQVVNSIQQRTIKAVEMMQASQKAVEATREKANQAGVALGSILRKAEEIMVMGEQIATAMNVQSEMTDKINSNMSVINSATQDTVASTDLTSESSNRLAELANRLRNQIEFFKT